MLRQGALTMTYKQRLLATISITSAMFAAMPVEAAPRHKSSSQNANAALLKEVEALKAQVDALNARLEVQEAAQRESVATIANTQATATTAQTQATAAATQAAAAQTAAVDAQKSVPAQVKTALASAPKGPAKWFDSTAITGRMYFNISHISQSSDGNRVARSTAFDIKRFYLGVDHKFNDVFSANLTTDVSLIANTNTVTGTAQSAGIQPGQSNTAPTPFPKTVGETLYIKKAYLQATLSKAVNFRAGSADLPWVPFVEDLYGYRWVEQTVIDRTGFGTSADWGVHMFGTLANGHVSYAVAAIDGAGYRNPLRSKSIDVEGRIAVNFNGVTAAVGGYLGKRAANTDTPYSPVNNAVTPIQTDIDVVTRHTAQRLDAVLAYVGPKLRVGGEYFYAKNWNRVTQVTEDRSEGYTGWASFNFYKTFSVFGKYEHLRPTKDTFPNLKERYFNIGLAYEPVKIVDLAIVFKRDRVDNGYFSAGNTNPSNFSFPVGGVNHGSYSEIGLFGQLRF